MPVHLEPTEIKASLGINTNGRIHRYFTNECAKAMDKFIPLGDTGNLRITKDVGSDEIIYEMPYARYQYYGVREDGTHKVTHYTTSGTGPYWDKRMWSARGTSIVKNIQKKFGGK